MIKLISMEPIIGDESIETTEVLIDVNDLYHKKLKTFIGDDGMIREEPFDIFRVRLTRECLQDLVRWDHSEIEYIEHPGDDGVVPLYQTENNSITDESSF
jgi:hypothetical protein